jgi:hypothetical protein
MSDSVRAVPCRKCGGSFTPKARSDAHYCSVRCRVAAHRKRKSPPLKILWVGSSPKLSSISRSFNADGTLALSNAELGLLLIEISIEADNGDPKTGRRFYYLALSYGYIQPDMGASKEAKDLARCRL